MPFSFKGELLQDGGSCFSLPGSSMGLSTEQELVKHSRVILQGSRCSSMFEVEKQGWKLTEVTWPTHDGAGPIPRSKTQSVTTHLTVVTHSPAFYLDKHRKANQLTGYRIPRIGGHQLCMFSSLKFTSSSD